MELYNANCLEKLPDIPDHSVDAIFADPCYPEIGREYGKMTVEKWMDMMQEVVRQSKRIVTKNGSAVFVIQPNSEKIGKMRTWVREFMIWAAKEWNLIQDMYWHNTAAQPNRHSQRKYGLMRPSVKMCVWLGEPDCYRNQDEVLLPLKESYKKHKNDNELIHYPSGHTMRKKRCLDTTIARGGSTPFNIVLMSNTYNRKCSGSFGHGAGTPHKLTEWWVKYITKPKDTVLDMFSGVGTTGVVCQENDRNYIGIENFHKYHEVACERLGVNP